ncbi:right-handed parallel beta-helix repeat-containing protein [Paenibacillus senegalensis]|uniref:right-handed parallel beta-helix repeat-containing protein n=1 Tax=Paenibacillus senegalensis TaxID=1465766 RepID=UPI0002888BE8|nr:NosD domain-containing protein [Paenibacillus senegalensis]
MVLLSRFCRLLLAIAIIAAGGTTGLAALSGFKGFQGYSSQRTAAASANANLQSWIDAAEEGDMLILPEGEYSGPVTISKSLELSGNGKVLIRSSGDQPVIELAGDHITLSGIHIVHEPADRLQPAVQVTGNYNRLLGLDIVTKGSGIYLRGADHNLLDDLDIRHSLAGNNIPSTYSDKGNGIDLLESNYNRIAGSRISTMHDAIYIENSTHNTVESNYAEFSRYGYHLMFSADSELRTNIGQYNITGAMIMSSDRIEVSENAFTDQSENVNSQGILLYDVTESLIEQNQIDGNRTGIYIEQVKDSTVSSNWIARNFIGVEMLLSQENNLTGNHFISNVTQAQSMTSDNNEVHSNFWDDLQGIDLSGQGVSSLPYKTDPFFLNLTRPVPAYQLFFQSPGIIFLQNMFPPAVQQQMVDTAPLMKPRFYIQEGNAGGIWTAIMASLLLLVSLLIIYTMGVRKQ